MSGRLPYLFVGTGSSMVLEPLAEALAASGRETHRFDPAHDDAAELFSRLSGRRPVLITSDHVFLTAPQQAGPVSSSDRRTHSVVELIGRLRPLRTACYPHDLVCLFESQDHLWLSLFDVVLVPDSRLGFCRRGGAVVEVGWARKPAAGGSMRIEGSTAGRAVHFLSGLIRYYEQLGLETLLSLYGPLYRQGVAVKAPLWPSSPAFERDMQDRGYDVVPATANHYEVAAEHEILIANGGSSVAVEMALSGREVWHVIDENLSPAELQIDVMRGFPRIDHLTLDECRRRLMSRERRRPAATHADILAPFDLAAAMAAVVID